MRIILLFLSVFGVANCQTQYTSDCRRLYNCKNGGTCTGSVCVCRTGYFGELCDNTGIPCTNSPCVNGGTCSWNGTDASTETCSCPTGYLGDNCQVKKVEGTCGGESMKFDISFPEEKFDGLVLLNGENIPQSCQFTNTSADGIITFSLELSFVSSTNDTICGQEYVIQSDEGADTNYTSSIRIQYNPDTIMGVDEIVMGTCSHSPVGNEYYVSFSGVGIDDDNLTTIDHTEKYKPLVFEILEENMQQRQPGQALYVGQPLWLYAYLEDTTVYKNLIISSCEVNNTNANAPKSFSLINENCPSKLGRRTVGRQEAGTTTLSNGKVVPTTKAKMITFKFVFSNQLGLSCLIRLCKEGDDSCNSPTQEKCEEVIAAAESAPDTGTETNGTDTTSTNGTDTTTNGTDTNTNGTETATNGTDTNTNGTETATNGTETATNGTNTTTNGTDTTTNGTDTTANGTNSENTVERKRRAADDEGERTVSTILTIRGTREFTSDANTGQPVDPSVDSCLAKSEILSVLIVLASVVCILLIACFIMAFCLIKRKQKSGMPAFSHYDNTERFQIPRVHVNEAYREI